jgi:hypothetical protein
MWNRWDEGDYSLPKTFTWNLPPWVEHAVVTASASTVESAGASATGPFHPVRITMQARY